MKQIAYMVISPTSQVALIICTFILIFVSIAVPSDITEFPLWLTNVWMVYVSYAAVYQTCIRLKAIIPEPPVSTYLSKIEGLESNLDFIAAMNKVESETELDELIQKWSAVRWGDKFGNYWYADNERAMRCKNDREECWCPACESRVAPLEIGK